MQLKNQELEHENRALQRDLEIALNQKNIEVNAHKKHMEELKEERDSA